MAIANSLSEEEAKFILGVQGNRWAEYIATFQQVEYMSMPRMAALSESLWIPLDKKNHRYFIMPLKKNAPLLDRMGVNYARYSESVK